MKSRVLTEKKVKRLAEIRKDGGRLTIGEVYDLVASHCLLQQRVKELEALIPKRLIQRVGGTETG